jgi:hypothetical protein
VLAILLLTPKRVAYRNHAVTFVHERVGYSYIDPAGTVLRNLQDGTEFLAYFNVGVPEQLHLATLTGAFVGTIDRLGGRRGMVDLRDKEGLAAAAAATATIFNRAVAEVRGRHADEEQQLAADRAHNEAIVAQHQVETAGMTTAEKIARAAGDAAARQAADKAAARRVQQRAAQITPDDVKDFLNDGNPSTPPAEASEAPVTGTTAPVPDERLSDYI